jgi:RNA polymerase sigma-70 factor (ECF subfamily)
MRTELHGARPDHPTGTLELLELFRGGNDRARDRLIERCLPSLRRWARGRLPQWARSAADTQDLVQDAVMRALPRLHVFEVRRAGALQSYLREAVQNRIYDEVRRVSARPGQAEMPDNVVDEQPSPLEQTITREGYERYKNALQGLRPVEREAIVARLELQYSYEEVATLLGKPNANAARMTVARAIVRLVEEMQKRR